MKLLSLLLSSFSHAQSEYRGNRHIEHRLQHDHAFMRMPTERKVFNKNWFELLRKKSSITSFIDGCLSTRDVWMELVAKKEKIWLNSSSEDVSTKTVFLWWRTVDLSATLYLTRTAIDRTTSDETVASGKSPQQLQENGSNWKWPTWT